MGKLVVHHYICIQINSVELIEVSYFYCIQFIIVSKFLKYISINIRTLILGYNWQGRVGPNGQTQEGKGIESRRWSLYSWPPLMGQHPYD